MTDSISMSAGRPGSARAELARVVRASGLIEAGSHGVVLISGGADSACAAAGLAALVGPANLTALTLNYGLREGADGDEAVCRELCDLLGIELIVQRPALEAGNLQEAARDARYGAAESLRLRRGADWVATGHTATDLAETLIYRLAVSPGSRALLGLPERRGALVRPLLRLERERTRELAEEAELPVADDPSNDDPAFARNRIRAGVLPLLRDLNPAAVRNIAETRRQLGEEAGLLAGMTADAIGELGAGSLGTVAAETLTALDPGLQRLVLRTLAERVVSVQVPLSVERTQEIVRLSLSPEGGVVELGGGLRALCEGGFVNFVAAPTAAPATEVSLPLPGSCRFGGWELNARLEPSAEPSADPATATLDATRLRAPLTVRAWRDGDRMRPLGMEGTKSLQDLFTDRRVPRSLRRRLPVVVAGGRIAWVAGVAVSDEFKLTRESAEVAILSATLAQDG